MSSRCTDRKNIKKYIDIYLITKIYICEPNSVLLFPVHIIFEIFDSLTCLYWYFVAADALFPTLVLKQQVFLIATKF